MDLVCPECRSYLEITTGELARCSPENLSFRIVFDREEARRFPQGPEAGLQPAADDVPASMQQCPSCDTITMATERRCQQCGHSFGLLNLTAVNPRRKSTDTPCTQHPAVMATHRCRICHSPTCDVCDFVIPPDLHVCPACIEREPSRKLSEGRLAMAIAGILCAIVCSLAIVLLTTGVAVSTFGGAETAAAILGNVVIWPGLAGIAFSFGVYERRLHNSLPVWISVGWNSVNLLIFALMVIVGVARGN